MSEDCAMTDDEFDEYDDSSTPDPPDENRRLEAGNGLWEGRYRRPTYEAINGRSRGSGRRLNNN